MARFILNAQLRLNAPGNIRQIVNQINKQLQGVTANINVNINQKQLQSLTKNFNQTSKAAKQATGDIEKFGEQAALAIRRYGAFTLATGAFIKLTQAISSGVDEAIKFDRELVRVAQVTGQSLKSLKGLSQEITKLSTEFGVSSTDILKASVTLSQAGLSVKDVQTSLRALAKTGVSATFGDIQDTTEATIAIFQQFGIQAEELEKTLSSVNKVSAAFAVESDDIAVAVRRAGGAFQAAGGNLNEFIALFTSVRQTTRESAESIATGFRTIFTRLQRTRTQNFFKQFGVDLKTLEGQFVGPFEAIKRISAALENLQGTDPRFNLVVEELGGFRQVSKVVPLLTQFEVANKALNIATRSGNSLTEDAAVAQDALAVKIQKVKEEFQDLIRTLTSNTVFRGIIDSTLELASALIKLTNSIEPLLPLLAPLGAIAVGGQLAKFGRGFKNRIVGFSKGGLVPGSGNGDTVPAMLTPGEFVLNKKAVKALGPSGLSTFSKFADGGLALPDPRLEAKRIRKEKAAAASAAKSGNTVEVDASKFAMIRPEKGTFGYTSVNNTAGVIADRGSSSASARAIVNKVFQEGGITDRNTKITAKIPTYYFNESVATKFDGFIEQGLTKAIDDFVLPLVGGVLDPKEPPPLDKLISKSAVASIKGQFFEAVVKRAASDFKRDDSDDIFDFTGPGKTAQNLDLLFGGGRKIIYPADAKAGNIDDAKLGVINKALRYPSLGSGIIKKFASGGSVGGSGSGDTVPALLTPGEFVVTKEAAKAVGYGNLNKVNRYASGGKVGAIANSVTNNPLSAFAGFAVLQVFVSQLAGANSELGQLTSTLGQVGIRFAAFNSIIETARNGIAKGLTSSNSRGNAAGLFSEKGFADFFFTNQASGRPGSLVTRREQIKKIAARRRGQALFGRLSGAATFAGAGLSIGGEFISSNASERIARGEDAVRQSAFGGALSGAGTGAALGAIFGPFGAAIGAAAGGIIGFTTSLSSAKKELDNVRFAQKLEAFGNNLEEFSKGRLTSGDISDAVITNLQNSASRIATADPDARKDIIASFKQNEQTIEKFFVEVAAGSADFAEFNQKTKGTLLQFAILNDIPLSSLNKEIKDSIGLRAKENQLQNNLNQLKVQEAVNLENMITLMEAFSAAGQDLEKFSSRIDAIVNLLNGQGLAGISTNSGVDLFKRAAKGEIGGANLEELGRRGAAITGAAGLNNDLVEELQNTALLFSKLPQIISQTNAAIPNEGLGGRTANEIANDFAKDLGITGKVLTRFNEVVGTEIIGLEGNDPNKIDKEFSDIQGTADKIRRSMDQIFDVFGNAAEVLEKREKTLINALSRQNELEQRRIDLQLDALSRQQDFNDKINELRANPTTFQGALNNLGARLGVASGEGGTAVNRNLGVRIRGVQDVISKLQGQLNDTEGKQARDNLITQIKEQESVLGRLNKALGVLTSDSSALSAGFRELDKEAQKNKFTGGLVETLLFGDREEKQKLSKTIFGANVAAKTNSVQLIPDMFRKDILEFFKSASKVEFPQFDNRTGNDILKEIVTRDLPNVFKQVGIDLTKEQAAEIANQTVEGGLSAQQEKLITEMQSLIDLQKNEQSNIVKAMIDGSASIETQLVNANEIFLKRLESIFLGREVGRGNIDIAKQRGDIQAREGFIKEARNIADLVGVNPNNTEELRARTTRRLAADRQRLKFAEAAQEFGGNNINDILAALNINQVTKTRTRVLGTDQGEIQESIPITAQELQSIKGQFRQMFDLLTDETRTDVFGRLSKATNRGDVAKILSEVQNRVSATARRESPEEVKASISRLDSFLNSLTTFGNIDKAQIELDALNRSTIILSDENRKNTTALEALKNAIDKLNGNTIQEFQRKFNANPAPAPQGVMRLPNGVSFPVGAILGQNTTDNPLNIVNSTGINPILAKPFLDPSEKEDALWARRFRTMKRQIRQEAGIPLTSSGRGSKNPGEFTQAHFDLGLTMAELDVTTPRELNFKILREKALQAKERRIRREDNQRLDKDIEFRSTPDELEKAGIGRFTDAAFDRNVAKQKRIDIIKANVEASRIERERRQDVGRRMRRDMERGIPITTRTPPLTPEQQRERGINVGQAQFSVPPERTAQNVQNTANTFNDMINNLTTKFNQLGTTLGNLGKIPEQIELTGNHKVEVIINGAQTLRELEPSIQSMVITGIENAFTTFRNGNGDPTMNLPKRSDIFPKKS